MRLLLDTNAVSHWCLANLEGFKGPLEISQFSGGQSNPTYRLQTPGRTYVLRRKPPGQLLKSAHAIDREFRVQRALESSAVPVAKMLSYCHDTNIIGSEFYVMELIEGRAFDQPHLPELDATHRGAIVDAMNKVLADIHQVDIMACDLNDFGPEGHYCRRQTDRWSKQYRASQTEEIPDMDVLINWLNDNMPIDDGQRTLVHGDYRLDNLIFHPDRPEITAVLDWELSTIGHPYADLASVIMQWSMPATNEGRGLADVDRSSLGLWSDEKFIDRYCQRRGLESVENFEFYLAFTYFRMAAILQGVKKRAWDGNAADPQRALRLGAYVPQFAKAGLHAAKA